MSDDAVTPELQELSDKIQAYFDFGIHFFDQVTSTVTYIALIFSTVSNLSLSLPTILHYDIAYVATIFALLLFLTRMNMRSLHLYNFARTN